MKIFFSHGKESGPNGSKIQRLTAIAKSHNCDVESIDYTDLSDPDKRVERLLNIIKQEKDNYILVGSSMGAYVSLVASEFSKPEGLFLMAPALYLPGYKIQKYNNHKKNIEIVHGWSDEIIPVENSIRFAKQANCTLHLIGGDHRLIDSIEIVASLFDNFLNKIVNY